MKLYKDADRLSPVPASPEDIIAAFNDLPLTARMLAFLRTSIFEIDERNGGVRPYAMDWPVLAHRWEREDAEKARKAAEVEDVAREIARGMSETGVYSESSLLLEKSRKLAGTLYAKGYRKQADEKAVGLHDCEYDDPRMCAWPGRRKVQS